MLPKYINDWIEFNKEKENVNLRRKSCDDVVNGNSNGENDVNGRKKSAIVKTDKYFNGGHKSCLILTATKCDLHLDR